LCSRLRALSAAIALGLASASANGSAHTEHVEAEARRSPEVSAQPTSEPAAALPGESSRGVEARGLPCEAFTRLPEKPHDPAALVFNFDQLEYWYRVPGEFTHRLNGDQYGFETMSFIVSETHPGGGPGLHVHDTEEAHILLAGTAQYRIGDETFTVDAPYVARVPAGVPHTFINSGTEPFNLIAVFATPRPTATRVGPNPLVPAWESLHGVAPCAASK
jgi:mannose-6-phosphate isomerase-like protein (cupin superfamily)